MTKQMCPCGKPLHYFDKRTKAVIDKMVSEMGENITITVLDKSYSVPRHYIALHGIKAVDLPKLGFEEITERYDVRIR